MREMKEWREMGKQKLKGEKLTTDPKRYSARTPPGNGSSSKSGNPFTSFLRFA
jgi:hypothetical protein